MEFNYYQQESLKTLLPQSRDINYLIVGLCAEAGEVAGHYAKQIRDNVNKTDLIIKEVGDVLYFCSAIADYYDINLSEVAESNISKLKSRMERGVLQGSGDLR